MPVIRLSKGSRKASPAHAGRAGRWPIFRIPARVAEMPLRYYSFIQKTIISGFRQFMSLHTVSGPLLAAPAEVKFPGIRLATQNLSSAYIICT